MGNAGKEATELFREIASSESNVIEKFRTAAKRRGIRDLDESRIAASFDALRSLAGELGPQEPFELPDSASDDAILSRITDLFDGRVGQEFDSDRLARESTTGTKRLAAKIPPGYADTKEKGVDASLGDYFAWRQILDEVQREPRSVLLVTNDQKEDWYQRIKGKILGPRPELSAEIMKVAGVRLHLATTQTFLSQAKRYLDVSVSDRAVDEAAAESEPGRPDFDRVVADLLAETGRAHRGPSAGLERYRAFESLCMNALRELGWLATSTGRGDYDAEVPLATPDGNPAGRIIFDFSTIEAFRGNSGARGRVVRLEERMRNMVDRYPYPVVLVNPGPDPITFQTPPSGRYSCPWGDYPRFQSITLRNLLTGSFDLPVEGIVPAE